MNQDKSQYYLSVAVCETKRRCRNWPQDGPGRDPSRQFFAQKFWVKPESTLIFLSKNLSVKSRPIFIYGKSTHLEQTLNFTENAYIFNWCLFSGMNFLELWWRCGISWVFNLPSVGIRIFSPEFDHSDLFFPDLRKSAKSLLHKLKKTEPAGVSGPRARPPPCSQFRKQSRGGLGGLEDNWAGDWWRPMVAGDRKKLHQFIRAVVCDEI